MLRLIGVWWGVNEFNEVDCDLGWKMGIQERRLGSNSLNKIEF